MTYQGQFVVPAQPGACRACVLAGTVLGGLLAACLGPGSSKRRGEARQGKYQQV